MVQVLERPLSQGERFLQSMQQTAPAFSQAFSQAMAPEREKEENEAIKRQFGVDLSGLSPDIKKLALQKLSGPQEGADQGIQNAVKALNEMEGMISKSGIGFMGDKFNYSGEARQNRGRFNALQSAIFPLFKSMFPRGMTEKEFKFINEKYMPQPADTEETIKGKISGLRQLIANPGEAAQMFQGQSETGEKVGKAKFSSENPEHRKKAEQLFKTYKDKEKVREILSREFQF